MRTGAVLVAVALALPVGATAATRPRGGLSVWPARVRVTAGGTAELHVANGSRRTAIVDARAAGLALDLRGAPRAVSTSAGTRLLAVFPRRLVVAPGAVASLTVRTAGRGAAPGDRPALVLLTTRSAGGAGIGVRVRIGVTVEVRVPGVVHRRLELGPLRRRGSRLELVVTNRGNVAERVRRGALVLRVVRRSRVVALLQPREREVLPRSRGLVDFPVPPRLHGRVRIVAVGSRLGARSRSYSVGF